jgi:ring-1,2-phenylacetyl-CoA epoxidase subunit PaaD
MTTADDIWSWLADIPDPEIPVISLVDLGVVRGVDFVDGTWIIRLTPTYTGCPATRVIAMSVETAMIDRGITNFAIKNQIAPPWTTDWISAEAHDKLRDYGIAPPTPAGGPASCPQCGATDLQQVSRHGSTPCKAQWRCMTCLEPFDYFKCI